MVNSPKSGVTVGTELAAKNGLSYIPALNLENHWATLRFATELKNEPGIGFGPDRHVQPRGGLVPVGPEVHPPVVDHPGAGAGGVEVNAEVDPAQ